MMPGVTSIAVLGCGRIGRMHARGLARHPEANLVAVYDVVPQMAAETSRELGVQAASSVEEVLSNPAIAAVLIATPTPTHVDLIIAAARAGKAVLCEKPIDLDIAKVDAAVQEIERLKGRVMVAFNRRFDPSVRQLRRAINAGEIGDVRQVIITSRDPGMPPHDYVAHSGGIFRDMVIHDFDMARWLLGEEPTEVMATASRLVDPGLANFGDFDTLMVQMRTASGRQCHINCCREAVYGYDQRMEIFGSTGMLLNENLRPTTVRRWSKSETEARDPLLNFFLERYADAYKAELDQFVDALENGSPMPTTPHDGRQALRLADCALESVLTGRAVKV
jgi:myo-inositol 2-dehydrogenase/D-chiro-inositol 1-dehydrogenase